MREALFIKRNAEKWKSYQQEPVKDPDESAERFITLMDDLAYARTFYPKSRMTQWINGLAASEYQQIYQNRKEKYSRVFSFFKYELPLVIRRHHRVLLFSALLFCTIVGIGMFASANNPEFVRQVMGDQYVDMTEDNIRKGDPFGVYRDDNPFNMFMRIALNNMRVGFLTFMGGFTLGIGTFYLVWTNGIMVGSFHHMFMAHDLGAQAVLVIWIHGTLELFTIILEATAGFVLANGFLFPGTFSRKESFIRGGKDAIKIVLCAVPFVIAAAFLESYNTQRMSQTIAGESGLPVWAGIAILAASMALIIYYFIIRPFQVQKRLRGMESAVGTALAP